ncbi:MAG: Uma2 family endonuclease [Chloroflexi bacterium]|nr:Uma2 family endonuclease [Chloroflexota bacterium]
MLPSGRPSYSVEEYLWQEERAASKSEYFDGTIYALAGGSPEHSQIQANIILELGTLFRGKDCRVLTSDLKIGVESKTERSRKKDKDFISYPDASVICGSLEFYKGNRYTIANPMILFEVLSPSTHSYDTSFKLEQYQRISSLKAYIMIDSERVWVRTCLRIGDQNRWILEEPLETLKETLRLEPLNIEIPLRLLYDRIEFTETEDSE